MMWYSCSKREYHITEGEIRAAGKPESQFQSLEQVETYRSQKITGIEAKSDAQKPCEEWASC